MHRRDLMTGAAALALAGWPRAGARAQGAVDFDAVVERARDLATRPFADVEGNLPEALRRLTYDSYRLIRYRDERAVPLGPGSPYRAQFFHPGWLYTRPVRVNIVREGQASPVAFSPDLFEYGGSDPTRVPAGDIGFAGVRINGPLNAPDRLDEIVSFLGASYFRFLGRGQRYGLSARGLAVDTATPQGEEFPFFREVWIEGARPGGSGFTVLALLDSASLTGAYRFRFEPGASTAVEVSVTLHPRRGVRKLGLAPLTSMFFYGENQPRPPQDFRPEVHDSDGLLIQNGAGEWLWRPLRNPAQLAVSAFVDDGVRGFGLMQRDRSFASYQDVEALYHMRPSYWVEPAGNWGPGHVELVEIPTGDEFNDNIVAFWSPRAELRPGEPIRFQYRLHAVADAPERMAGHPGGRVVNTFVKRPTSFEAPAEHRDPLLRRFLVDFEGGDLAYFRGRPELLTIALTVGNGQAIRSILTANAVTGGFRAIMDVRGRAGQTVELRAELREGERRLTESWLYGWRAEA
jgi:glucans biosynthesis protein